MSSNTDTQNRGFEKSDLYLKAANYGLSRWSQPCSDGLTIPLLAKRASSAGGKGILQNWEKEMGEMEQGQTEAASTWDTNITLIFT